MKAEVHPAHIIRSYAWKLLNNNQPFDWTTSNYGGKIPIVPLSEEPDISEYSWPYIIYGYAYDPNNRLYARKTGSMTFAIYDQDNRRLGRTMNTLVTAFEREDEAARDVNRYTDMLRDGTVAGSQQNSGFQGLTFGYISMNYVESGVPEETEGGRQSALISLRYEYHVDYDVTTDPSKWVR
jgi:hypothetical protein